MFAKIQSNKISVALLVIVIILLATPALAAPSYSAWSPSLSIESLPGSSAEVNTASLDGCPILSRDGLQLYMASNRPGSAQLDIWVAERASADAGFGAPVNVGGPINSAFNDFCPSPLRDGQGFMFVSNRDGGCGGADIYMTRYEVASNSWQTPINLGCEVNSSADEAGPVLVFAEAGPPTLYFSSTRPDELGGSDLYMSEMMEGWLFAPAALVPNVNSEYDDMQPSVRRDAREIVFSSNRPGGLGFDIWSASRESISDPWVVPENLGSNVNSSANETRPSLSWDAKMLLFGTTHTGVEGVSDIYYSTR